MEPYGESNQMFAQSVHVDGLHNDVHCTFICKRLLLQELAKSVDIYRYLYIYMKPRKHDGYQPTQKQTETQTRLKLKPKLHTWALT